MPLPEGPGVRLAYSHYWGAIAESARSGWTTAQLWGAIRAAATEAGMESPGISAIDVSKLRGVAGRMEAAAQTLQSAGRDTTIDARMIADPPWSRPLNVQAEGRQYQVRYLSTISQDGVEKQIWRSVKLNGTPQTTRDIQQAIDEAVSVEDQSVPGEFVNLESYMLLAI
jgi:hypothetical protein